MGCGNVNKQGTYRIAVRGLIIHDGKILLMERSKEARGEFGYWELPGGGLEFGEAPEEALKREIDEEVQMKVEILSPLSVWHYIRKEQVQIIGFTFLCKALTTDVILSDEHVNYAWIHHSEIIHYKIFPELKEEMQDWNWELISKVK